MQFASVVMVAALASLHHVVVALLRLTPFYRPMKKELRPGPTKYWNRHSVSRSRTQDRLRLRILLREKKHVTKDQKDVYMMSRQI
jgi:hypothetical protein